MTNKLRWLVTERRYETWNSRADDWDNHCIESRPVLQQLIDEVWVTVPTEIEVINDSRD